MCASKTQGDTREPNPVISVVLPAYLEEENLRLLLPRIHVVLETLGVSFEVIVVDTSVPLDATREVAAAAGIRAIGRTGGDSYGDAVRTGIAASVGDWVIFMDADGSHPPEWISKLYLARDEHDLVIASRYVDQGFTENSRALVLMSRMLNWTYSIVLGIHVNDISNSFRLYRGCQLRALVLNCDHFDIVEEILIKLLRAHQALRIREIPFTFKKRMFGDSKRNLILFTLGYLFTLIRLRFLIDLRGQVLRFCCGGVLGMAINITVFSLTVSRFGAGLNLAAIAAFVIAAALNFALNRIWTLRRAASEINDDASGWKRNLLVYVAGLGINLAVLNTVTAFWGLRFLIPAQLLGIVSGATANFLSSRRYVFGAAPDTERAAAS